MVHFTQYRLRILFYSDIRMTRSHAPDYSIRSSAGQRICAPLRGFSQLITTFIALQLHRHPPWTYISLDHIIFSIPAYLFSATSASGFFYLCQAFRPFSLAIRSFVSYLHSSLSGFTLQELMFLPFTFTVKEPFLETNWTAPKILENRGLEPLTLGLQSRCSSQLS